MRLALSCAACVLVLIATACAGDDNESDEPIRSKPASSAPLTYAEVVRRGEGTPGGTVFLLWFWVQWGSAPNVLGMYDLRVREALGPETISGLYTWLRGTLVELRPRIVSEIQKKEFAFVAVEGRQAANPPVRYAFLLRRAPDGWIVMHDTLLESWLPEYISTQVDGPGREPSPEARARGERLAERYRNLFPNIQLSESG